VNAARPGIAALAGLLALLGAAPATEPQAPAANPAEPTMMAVRIHEFGGPEKLVVDEVPRPKPGAGEVLVKVRSAGVNPVDWKIRSGKFADPRWKLPITLGYEICGVVESLGADVKDLKAGDEVYGMLTLATGGGYAEYAVVPVANLAKKPKNLDSNAAGGVPLAALTAWQALFDKAGLAAGQTVLVHGGSGGVGHFAVQLAKAKGAKVLATASTANQAFLKEIGADVAIDYKTQKFEEIAKDVDVVLDSVGGDTLERSYGIVKKGGFIVSIVTRVDPKEIEEKGLRGASCLVTPDADELREITKLIEAGKVKPFVGATFPLAQAAEAQKKLESGGTRGKIVLVPTAR
jgi:NADPH:quinone reductase-like Zn-dependent oxidoreductase